MTKNSSKLNKKIVVIASAVVIAVAGVVATVFALNNNRNSEEYAEQSEIYDRRIEIAKKVNSEILDSEQEATEAISQEVGDDKSRVEELSKSMEEILTYKIEIPENKTGELNQIKEDNKKLAESLNKIDENLADLSFEEVEQYTVAKGSKVGVLSEKISSLVKEIKAQAEKYAKEKAAEEAKQKILKGDLSAFEGTYSDSGYNVVVKNDGFYVGNGNRVFKTADMTIKQGSSGSYIFETKPKTITSVTGYSMDMTNSFTISADGKTIEFADGENLCAYKLTKTN
ncbi:hypothetical protein IJ768_02570 [Candidatus Saccharibacteria bacterium]|nr:hypothetical protein [Candidatus Saccharibacteria bacterium]